MKLLKKLIAGVLGVFLIAGAITPLTVNAAGAALRVTTPGNAVLTYKYGEAQDFVMNLENIGDTAFENLSASVRLRNDADKWPFKTDYQSYTAVIERLEPGAENMQSISFNFTEREDVKTGRFILVVDFRAGEEQTLVATEQFYVNTTAKPEDNKDDNKNDDKEANNDVNNNANTGNDPQPFSGGDDLEGMSASAGGFSNGDASYSGGESPGNGSVPRVIVTGFNTDPGDVKAGSNFTLVIHLKNTSKTTKVQNMLFDLAAPTEGTEQTAAPAFLPASGSNSIYLDSIPADGTADISIQLNAKADLVQKPYSINMSMKYEDKNAAQIDGASSISIPVKQDARFEFSEFDTTSESIAVGEEANISCNLYNLGRIKLYNVKVIFEGSGVKREEMFLGNVEPGATASIDAMLEGTKAAPEPGKVKMTMTYEDEAGTISKSEKELQLLVTEAVDEMAMTDMQIEQKKGLPLLPVGIGVAVAAALIIIIIAVKKKKKKLLLEEEGGLMDELDRPSEDE